MNEPVKVQIMYDYDFEIKENINANQQVFLNIQPDATIEDVINRFKKENFTSKLGKLNKKNIQNFK